MKRLQVNLIAFSTWSMTLLVLLILSSCVAPTNYPSDDGLYKLPHGVEGASDKTIMLLQKSLTRCGIKVISIGQDYLVSIPSLALFPEQSPRLTWKSYTVLNKIIVYMKQFRKISVTITSYSSKYRSVKREHALTLARARAIGDYLRSQDIDSRFVVTQGAGSDKPVTDYLLGGDRSPNSRIEITFQEAIM